MVSVKDALSYIVSGKGIFDGLCDLIIRPGRSEYDPLTDLGPAVFRLDDGDPQRYARTDLQIENMRGLTLQCSWFRTYDLERRPCVIYIHGNCGSRYDALEALFLLKEGFSLFCFDASGSGLSDGEYISLGFYERQDLAAVVDYLGSQKDVKGIGLWGRSMGAVTSIMYAAKDSSIKCIVCDSPFSTLRLLVRDLAKRYGSQHLPSSLIDKIVNRMRKRIAQRAAFNIDDLNTLKYAAECTVPSFIFHGSEDDFVIPQNSAEVSRCFRGPCLYHLVDGGHNDERNEQVRESIKNFFMLYLVIKCESRDGVGREPPKVANEQQSDFIATSVLEDSPSVGSPESTYVGDEPGTVVPESSEAPVVREEVEKEEEHACSHGSLVTPLAPVKVTKPWFYDPSEMV
uniref:Uncharacterized protein TCIL3000_6_1400 n=1 Tax=Trypanosoma congolense (strain IL3000) TaxID=1068625 RepID=G0UNE8_TRYCI|nr:unnamed protein product [Trypanosoma congolense IL3000]